MLEFELFLTRRKKGVKRVDTLFKAVVARAFRLELKLFG